MTDYRTYRVYKKIEVIKKRCIFLKKNLNGFSITYRYNIHIIEMQNEVKAKII